MQMMIKNSVLEGFTILRFSLERLKERERALVLLSTLSGLLLLWYLLSYTPQSNALNRTKASINDVTRSTAQLTQKRTMIEGLVKDNSVSKLMARYEHVQNEMKELENNINRYQTRYIDYKHLSSLLYSILQQTTDVSIVTFSNTSTILTEGTQETPPSAPAAGSTPQPAPATPAQTVGTAAPTPPPDGPKVERYQYKLILKGSYAPITNYLSKLEATGWQFYWDKLTYVVQKHPDALVTIEFYTLRPTASEQPSPNGGRG
jgi:hypothetical protein